MTGEPIVRRYERNPILTRDQVPYPVETVHNAAVVKHGDRYVMLFRSHLRNGRSIIGLAESDDGLRFRVDPKPLLVPAEREPFATYEEFGVEDPRVTGSPIAPTRATASGSRWRGRRISAASSASP